MAKKKTRKTRSIITGHLEKIGSKVFDDQSKHPHADDLPQFFAPPVMRVLSMVKSSKNRLRGRTNLGRWGGTFPAGAPNGFFAIAPNVAGLI